MRASYSVENLAQDDYSRVLDICVLNNSCTNKQRKPSTGLGHSKPSSPAAPSCKQQPQANRTPLFRLSADILHIPPPPRLSHLKIRAPKSPSPPPFREADLAAQATPHNQLRAHSLSHQARPCPQGQVTSENESGPSKAALTPLKALTPL